VFGQALKNFIDFLKRSFKFSLMNQTMQIQNLMNKKFDDLTKYVDNVISEIELKQNKKNSLIQSVITDIEKTLFYNTEQLKILFDYSFIDKSEKYQYQNSVLEEKFIEYIKDNFEQTKSIYYFFKTAMLHKTFRGEVSLIDIIDAIFEHYFDISFDEINDCIDKKIIIESLPISVREKINK
jgi:hypothetical protein